MSEFLRRYLDLGLSQIVRIDYSWHEKQSGNQEEHTCETIVARRGNECVKLSIDNRHTFGWVLVPHSGLPLMRSSTWSNITACPKAKNLWILLERLRRSLLQTKNDRNIASFKISSTPSLRSVERVTLSSNARMGAVDLSGVALTTRDATLPLV